jgi:hypothetical protein
MDFAYILSQIFTIIMFALLGLSYLAKKRTNILIISLIATLFGALAYILLSAWTGLAMVILGLVRNLYLFWDAKRFGERKTIERRDVIVLIVFMAASIALTIPGYNGPLSLMSFFAAACYTYSVWQKDPIVYKFLGIPGAVLWLIYNGFVKSLFGVILEVVMLAFSIYGYVVAVKAKNEKHHGRA